MHVGCHATIFIMWNHVGCGRRLLTQCVLCCLHHSGQVWLTVSMMSEVQHRRVKTKLVQVAGAWVILNKCCGAQAVVSKYVDGNSKTLQHTLSSLGMHSVLALRPHGMQSLCRNE